ncbi:Molybdenum cofactor sulfurase [Blattella germanica]|nr:Molybdenum cofactor sulfurase [Blattella germanica]
MNNICYLDHAGATLYADSQIEAVAHDLCENVYGNPHALNTTKSFNWIGDDVAPSKNGKVESKFNGVTYTGAPGKFMYLKDNHTSVLGMRELAKNSGAEIECLPHAEVFNIFNEDYLESKPASCHQGNSLFIYPAQCNFSGVKYPLSWISKVQNGILNGRRKDGKQSKWFCFLDAASFVSTNPLDLSKIQPDFVCMSFYKMFGYPTGLGALLVKNTSASVLKRDYYGDGTIPFLSIIALRHGFAAMESLAGDMSLVAQHTFSLAQHLFQFLLTLHHADGSPAAVLYCDTDYQDVSTQGNIVNFNMLRPSGEYVGFVEVLNMANLHGIQLRTGCFCNPGACQRHLGLSDEDSIKIYQAGHVCGDDKDLVNGQPTGTVRASFGYMTTKKDVDKLIKMLILCFVHGTPVKKQPIWWSSFQHNYLRTFKKIHKPVISVENSESLLKTNIKMNGHLIQSLKLEPKSKNDDMKLSHIYVYPVKSCGALKVESWIIGPRGFLFDREWMVVTSAGVCLTQKQDTKLCLVQPYINLGLGLLILRFPGMVEISVPLDVPSALTKVKESSLCQSKVCGDRVQGWDCGDDVAAWLSEALGREGLRLIRQWSSDSRVSKGSKKTLLDETPKAVLSLSNQSQFLLINSNSIQWLCDQIDPHQENLDKENIQERFRSNLVIQGAQAFVENEWTFLQIGNVKFQSEGPCTRCQMVCIDQTTGEKTREPLRTLAAALHGKMRFGVYLSHMTGGSDVKISVGDTVSSYQTAN